MKDIQKKKYIIIIGIILLLIIIGICAYRFHCIKGAELSYLGAILGGSLTLFGVWWTIEDQRESRLEELSIQFRPMVILYDEYKLFNDHIINDLYFNYDKTYKTQFKPKYMQINEKHEKDKKICFSVKNIGKGDTKNFKFTKIVLENKDIFCNYILDNNEIIKLKDLLYDQELAFNLNFPMYLKIDNSYQGKSVVAIINIYFNYEDEFQLHAYDLCISLEVLIEIHKVDNSPNIIEPKYTLVKKEYEIVKVK
ncbi:MAG: hypothetical protein LUG60_14585 [Erysipelotrichaceae bacterium]|nr:hypothetical protein [Erysipelotrichaceae bacterium]